MGQDTLIVVRFVYCVDATMKGCCCNLPTVRSLPSTLDFRSHLAIGKRIVSGPLLTLLRTLPANVNLDKRGIQQ